MKKKYRNGLNARQRDAMGKRAMKKAQRRSQLWFAERMRLGRAQFEASLHEVERRVSKTLAAEFGEK
ncbi:hypothetical protein M3P21_08790 [Ruegeria sp. 2012CJ41-6]|uniref:Uncharacterized protein n=1 Tax=Ruegeria spongiae TaxID=2942209 RepID=A0ABT0Q1E0_9RHOB|nr:hypothetical protein [Ruegeria spongiae]MCL6283626.1 hypothetical protein [Ruegeria spongiae]